MSPQACHTSLHRCMGDTVLTLQMMVYAIFKSSYTGCLVDCKCLRKRPKQAPRQLSSCFASVTTHADCPCFPTIKQGCPTLLCILDSITWTACLCCQGQDEQCKGCQGRPQKGGGVTVSTPLVHHIAVLSCAMWDKGQWQWQWMVNRPTCRRVLTTSAGWVHQAARAALPAEQVAMPQPGNCPTSFNCTAQHASLGHSAGHKQRDVSTYITHIFLDSLHAPTSSRAPRHI